MLYLISTAFFRPGTRERCIPHAMKAIEASRNDPGCVAYDMNLSITDSNKIVFVEVWDSRAALDAHFQTEHFKAWRAAVADDVLSRKLEFITPAEVESK